jgi:hypothetical protein
MQFFPDTTASMPAPKDSNSDFYQPEVYEQAFGQTGKE